MTSLTVNGRAFAIDADPETPLLWVVRDILNLVGTKYGCGTGDCGACTVEIDGSAVRSCQAPLQALEGASITTIEGLSQDRGHPVQQAWVAEAVPQCGYCQSGMIMAAATLLKTNADPSEADINLAMTNICRCGTYPRIRRAIARASRVMRGLETIAAAPPPSISADDAANAVPALTPPQKK